MIGSASTGSNISSYVVADEISRRLETSAFCKSISSSKDMRGESSRYGESSRGSDLTPTAFETFLAFACVTSRLLLGVSLTL
jgi:hypothetical protein